MPPRHAKTETISVRYPVYRLEQDRTLNALITGYNERFARRLGRKARNIARPRLGLATDKQAADEWSVPEGGTLVTRGVGSPPTGIGFGLIVIDDPIRRREDAESEIYREKVWDWYTDDLYTRLEPGGAIILVMTRWHEDDVGTRAIASEPGRWTILRLPAFAETPDPVGRAAGAPLWPDRYDATALTRIKDVLVQNEGLRSWEALYQQNPTPREGALFKVSKLGYVETVPRNLPACRAWDMGATAGGGNYSAGVRIEGPDTQGLWYVVDIERGQWDTDTRNRRIKETAARDSGRVRIRGPQDPGAAGVEAANAFTRMLAGYSVRTERVSGSKETRADPFSAQVNAGNVRLLIGDWNKAFVEELRSFPGGKSDDQVDAAADAFNELAGHGGTVIVSNRLGLGRS